MNEFLEFMKPYVVEAGITFAISVGLPVWGFIRQTKAVKELLQVLDKSSQHNQDLADIAVKAGLKLGEKQIKKLLPS